MNRKNKPTVTVTLDYPAHPAYKAKEGDRNGEHVREYFNQLMAANPGAVVRYEVAGRENSKRRAFTTDARSALGRC